MAPAPTSHVRRGEIIAALSLATDLAMGQPMDFALKSCVLATRIGYLLRLAGDEIAQVYYQSLLRYIGCNSETHVLAALFGDEIEFRRDFALIDMGAANEMAAFVFSHLRRANADAGALTWIGNMARGLITSKGTAATTIAGHCEVAERLAERLDFDASVRRNLGQLYERWDGKGLPRGLKREAIAPAVRVVCFAQDVIVLTAAYGAEACRGKLEARRGKIYDPRLVDIYTNSRKELVERLDETTWEDVLALEPAPHTELSAAELDAACLAMADFADLKSPYAVGHSRAVSHLAEAAARAFGLPEGDAVDLRRAGLLHDIGQVAIPARIWLKSGAFNDGEWEQVRLHPYYAERILGRASGLARLGAVIAQHHERIDGSGYHRGSRPPALTAQGKILAAAEAYQNKVEARPHRSAASPSAAAEALRSEVRAGRLDGDAVSAVLAAAGHRAPKGLQAIAGLTEREVDVLRKIARGLTMKQIARAFGIAPKTVDNHAQKIYAKIGVNTRGGATLYAIEHGLCDPQ